MQPLVFAAQSAQSETDRQGTSERLVNMLAEQAPSGGRSPVTLRSVPGIATTATLGSNPIRAMFAHRGAFYLVTAGRFYENTGSGWAERMTVPDDADTYLDAIGDEVAVVAGGEMWVWNTATSAATQVTAGAFNDYGSVAALDGFLILTERGGTRHQVTGIFNATVIGGLDFASAEQNADLILQVLVDHDEVWFFGERSVEVWANTGGADYPLTPVPGGVIERGLKAKGLTAKMDNSVFFVGDDGVVYRAAGFSPQRISTHPVEQAIASGTLTRLFVYEFEGHKVLVLRFSDRPAWCFDAATGVWHERRSGDEEGPWRVTYAAAWGGVWYAGSDAGQVGTFSTAEREEFGASIHRMAQSRNIQQGGSRFTVSRFVLHCEMGESAERMGFQFSRDAGRTWGREVFRGLGGVGGYERQIVLHGLGMGRNFAARVNFAEPAEFTIYGAGIEVS